MRRPFTLLLVAMLLLPITPVSHAQDDAAIYQLVEQARFWEERDDTARAAQAWQRVLDVEPEHHEALGRLAALRLAEGDRSRAEALTARLRALDPESRWLRPYQEQRRAGTIDREALSRARELAEAQDLAEALEQYERAFDNEEPPTPALASEYYEVMGGVPNRRDEAIAGLRALERAQPDSPRHQLARARVQSYDRSTRREALDTFEALQQRQQPPTGLRDDWRQALIWLEAELPDLVRFDRYLRHHGPDAEITQRRQQLAARAPDSPQAQRDAAITRAFEALDEGRLDEAESRFSTLRAQHPRSAQIAGGLGLVRLQQERFEEAAELLDTAMSLQPGRAGQWQRAARSASFYRDFERAQAAEREGRDETALNTYRRAFDDPPADIDPTMRLPYAEALLRAGELQAAEEQTRRVRDARPEDGEAAALLVRLYLERGDIEAAEDLARQAPPAAQAALAPARARALRDRAADADARGERERAKALLREAIVLAPDSPWPRLDLARILRAEGDARAADRLIDSLAETHPEMASVQLVQAYALADAERWGEVLQVLETLPAEARDREAVSLQRRAWIHYQVERAAIARQAGDHALAFRALAEADAAAGQDPAYAGLLAGGWAGLGDPARALGYLRRAFADQPDDTALRLQYAGLLLEMQQLAEFEAQAEHLLQESLSPEQSAELESLIVGFRIAVADRQRQQGRVDAAYDTLRDVIRRRPRDRDVQMALARVFEAAGDHAEALAIYDGLAASSEDSDPAIEEARINAMLAAGHTDAAGEALQRAEKERPADPALHELRARLHEARGNEGLALRHYERARALRSREQTSAPRLRPPRLALIDAAERDQPLTPRPVRDAMQERNPQAPEQVLRPRPSPFARPVAPSDERAATPAHSTAQEDGANDALAREDRIETLRARTSAWTGGAFHSRVRDGESGLSRLFNLELPMRLQSRATPAGRFGLSVTPVLLDSGDVSGPQRERFGTLALIDGGADGVTHSQSDSGVAVGLHYTMGSFEADIGSTPLGFAEERLVGGLRWAPSFDNWQLELALSRRAVGDSVLSYAGTRDPLSGVNFGGINRNKARVDLAYDFGDFGVYGNAGFRTYDGRNTDDNHAFEIGGGAYARAFEGPRMALTYGLNLTSFFYDKNRRFFTLGHGGYFSPQSFVSVGVPVTLEGQYGDLVWQVGGAIGLQAFNEDGAAFFPNNPGLQEQLEDIIALDPDSELLSGYPDNSQSGLGYAFTALAEYRLSRHFFAGGRLATDNARDFNEYHFAAFLRYYFDAQVGLPEAPRALPTHFEGTGR